jgi:hypothetical protein
MNYANSHRAPVFTRSAIAVLVFAALVVPAHGASAQLGGLAKRARDKVVDKQVDKQIEKRTGGSASTSVNAPPTYDDVTLELTTDRVDGVIRGLSAGRAVLEGTSAAPGRAALVARRDEATTKREDLSSRNEKLLNAYVETRDDSERCRSNAMYASRDKRQQAAQRRSQELQAKAMSDPAYREKVLAVSQKMGVAQQKGDTAEFRRLAAEIGLADDDTKADTVAADKACGRLPAKPTALVQIEQLDAQANALSEQIRQLEEQAAATEVKQSGMNERQFHMARERIEAFLSAMKYKSKPGAFGAAELEALGARQAELEKVM